jgi:hypothetical protein
MKVIGITNIPPSYDALENCWELGLFFPLKDVLIVGSKPTKILRNHQNQLHCENGSAIEWSDGYKQYYLNGIGMKEKYVMTSSEKLDPGEILKEPNVEIRRELIKKTGIERMLSVLKNRLLDKRGNYELYSIELSDEVKDARYLKMINPSVGCFHMEAVGPECKNVGESLRWRNSNWYEDAEILT